MGGLQVGQILGESMNAAPTNECLILPASGLASRIGGIPKALLPCGEAESLLTRHVANAMAASIEPVIVTRSELVEVFRSHVLSVLGIEVPVLAANTANMTQTVSVALVHLPDIEVFSVFLPDTYIDPPRY